MKKNVRVIIVAILGVCLCVGYYYYLSHRPGTEKQMSEVDQILTMDLEKSYPKTPREVVRLYNRILECLYKGDYEEGQMAELAKQARVLLDQELLDQNPEDNYLLRLEGEISTFELDKKEIVSVSISTSNEVEYKEVKDSECAYVDASYFMKTKDGTERANQTYILRKSQDGRWKVMGFYKSE